MDSLDTLKSLGAIAGLGGVGIGAAILIFRDIVRKNIFPRFRRQEAFILIILIVILTWSISIYAIYAYINKSEGTTVDISDSDCNIVLVGSQISDGTIVLKDTPCTSDPILGISYIWLDDISISHLLAGRAVGTLSGILGSHPTVLHNEVVAEIKYIYDTFGFPFEPTPISTVSTRATDRSAATPREDEQQQTTHNLSNSRLYIDQRLYRLLIPLNHLPDVDTTVYQTASMIKSYWRYLQREDIANYRDDLEVLRDQSSVKLDPASQEAVQQFEWGSASLVDSIHYFTRHGWPEDFLVVESAIDFHECYGFGQEIWFYPRNIFLKILVIENAGTQSVRFDDLALRASDDIGLRKATQSWNETKRSLGTIVLRPGQKLVIPTAIKLVPSSKSPVLSGKSILIIDPSSDPEFKETLSPPGRPPSMSDYIFGPELEPTGIVIGSETFPIRPISAEPLFTVGEWSSASCPYLYSYDSELDTWVNNGEILVGYHSRELEDRVFVEVEKFYGTLRVSEYEFENTYIDQILVSASDSEGRAIWLVPKLQAVKHRDGVYLKVGHGEYVDIEFEGESVRKLSGSASVIISGFYQPYLNRTN